MGRRRGPNTLVVSVRKGEGVYTLAGGKSSGDCGLLGGADGSGIAAGVFEKYLSPQNDYSWLVSEMQARMG